MSFSLRLTNAGIGQNSKPLPEQKEDEYDDVFNTNVKSVWLCMQYQIPFMQKSGGGVIVNSASVLGVVGMPVPIYTASKHVVVGLTKAIAIEYAKENIRVNALCSGGAKTESLDRLIKQDPSVDDYMKSIHPMGRIAKPHEIAEGALWLCSDKSSFMTGQSLIVDGGWSTM